MSLLDFILNLAALLLWLNWRAVELSAATRPSVLSLASALKRAEPKPVNRWSYLIGLSALLIVRALFYWQAGPPLNWTPFIHLGTIALPFHSEAFSRMFLFSFSGFLVTIGFFYLALILLSVVNRKVLDTDPLQRIVRLQLGAMARLPGVVRIAVAFLVVTFLWLLLNRPLVSLGLSAPPVSSSVLCQQSIAIGLGIFLSWKYVIVVLLIAYSLNSYVYLGSSLIWNYVNMTGRNLLAPLRWLPLGIGKADFAPVVGIALVLVIAHYLGTGLTTLYKHPPF
ncbi:MAG TPA: hypothetical protein VLU94_01900 [Candidatus Nitrosotalea sp.]|nr:hypothetical protein [Candidatus Nitrosotalea sp.]